jgi:hypothetical protein
MLSVVLLILLIYYPIWYVVYKAGQKNERSEPTSGNQQNNKKSKADNQSSGISPVSGQDVREGSNSSASYGAPGGSPGSPSSSVTAPMKGREEVIFKATSIMVRDVKQCVEDDRTTIRKAVGARDESASSGLFDQRKFHECILGPLLSLTEALLTSAPDQGAASNFVEMCTNSRALQENFFVGFRDGKNTVCTACQEKTGSRSCWKQMKVEKDETTPRSPNETCLFLHKENSCKCRSTITPLCTQKPWNEDPNGLVILCTHQVIQVREHELLVCLHFLIHILIRTAVSWG